MMVTLHDTQFVKCGWWNDGWTVKTLITWRSSVSMIPAPGDDCSGWLGVKLQQLTNCLWQGLCGRRHWRRPGADCTCWLGVNSQQLTNCLWQGLCGRRHWWRPGGDCTSQQSCSYVKCFWCMCVCVCVCVCMCACMHACVRACVRVCVLHLHCSAQLSMFNLEKRYRNKIIIIIITKHQELTNCHWLCLRGRRCWRRR